MAGANSQPAALQAQQAAAHRTTSSNVRVCTGLPISPPRRHTHHADLARQVGAEADGGQLIQLLLHLLGEIDALHVAAAPAQQGVGMVGWKGVERTCCCGCPPASPPPPAAAPDSSKKNTSARLKNGAPAALPEETFGDRVHGDQGDAGGVLGAHLHQHLRGSWK